MKTIFLILLLLATSIGFAQTPQVDLLLQKNLTLKTTDLAIVMKKTESNIKLFVDNFDVKLDSGTKIVSAKQVGGTILQPVLKVSVKKCVLFVCQTNDLDAEFTLEKVTGSCDYNYKLIADLQRSSPGLTDLYSHFVNEICIKKTTTAGTASVKLTVNLLRAPTYITGVVQKETFKFIKLQADGLVNSFTKVMKLNGATAVTALP